MTDSVCKQLQEALKRIDRPGTYCVGGSKPAVLPGLEVADFGPVGLPLTERVAKELIAVCEQAPYGKGEETLVDTSVRRVWQLKPDRFSITNPDFDFFLADVVLKVQEELGLGDQNLDWHLYDLLVYEKGGFFLPHKDGEKLDRMVATLVVGLPATFEGGELVVRHDGAEQVVDFSDHAAFRIHYAAFYADCEHEVKPLRSGYRLCLVYNLTLAKPAKNPITAPSSGAHIAAIARILAAWAEQEEPRKVVLTLQHEYTQAGLVWDALKGVDRIRAKVLAEAASQAGCQIRLAQLTLHESGSAEEYDYRPRHRRRSDEEDEGEYEMDEVYDTEMTLTHWSLPNGERLSDGGLDFDEEELVDPAALRKVKPEEDYEGYTGNAGMTLDRWYRHGAVVLWPNRRNYSILSEMGGGGGVESLARLVGFWKKASGAEAETLRVECLEFAKQIIASRTPSPHSYYRAEGLPDALLAPLADLGHAPLIGTYLTDVVARDVSVVPGPRLATVCNTHGWGTFRPELEAIVRQTTADSLSRNIALLDQLCQAKPKKREAWLALCSELTRSLVSALVKIEKQEEKPSWRSETLWTARLTGLARAAILTGQEEALAQLVAHARSDAKKYPLREAHIAALTAIQPFFASAEKVPMPALTAWTDWVIEELGTLTAAEPQPPADFRRAANMRCSCADCTALKKFLADPNQEEYHFKAAESKRSHLKHSIEEGKCDLKCSLDQSRRPYVLICTKNDASYRARLKVYHDDVERLATVKTIRDALA